MRNGFCAMILLLALCGASPCRAEMVLHISSEGNGVFVLDGDDVKRVEAADITIHYDATSLANPRVEAQGGTLTDVSDRSGVLVLKVFRPEPEMMFQLQLTFEKIGQRTGGITDVTTTVRDVTGGKYEAPATIFDLTAPIPEARPQGGSGANIETYRQGVTGRLTKAEKSVLQRFEEFRGTRGRTEFAALFGHDERKAIAQELTCKGSQCRILYERLAPEEITQEPAVAISDGRTPVMIRLELEADEELPPDIEMWDAELVSREKAGARSWAITAIPRKGTWEATLIVGTDRNVLEFPLAVAPAVKIQDDINDENFLAALDEYLSGRITGYGAKRRSPRQILHEYLFTANYLAYGKNRPGKAGQLDNR